MEYTGKISTESWGSALNIEMPQPNKGNVFFGICDINDSLLDSINKDAITTPHKHDFYQLIWAIEGEGTHYIDFVRHEVKNGRIFFCAPKQCHSFEGIKLPKGIGIVFNDAFLTELNANFVHEIKYKLFRRYGKLPYCDISIKNHDKLMDIVGLMQNECADNKKDYRHNSFSLHLLSLFFITLKRIIDAEDEQNLCTPEETSMIAAFIDAVERHYKERHNVGFYANELNCSESKLSRTTQKILSVSPLKIINDRKLTEAQRLLCFSKMSIKNISVELGFDSNTYFVSFFQKTMGICPQKFRDNYFEAKAIKREAI